MRQVVGVFLRAYWVFPLALVAVLITNDLFNTFRDANGRSLAPNLLGPALLPLFFFGGLVGGWRTRRVAGGIAASVGSHVCAWVVMKLWWIGTTYPFALSQQHNPYWVQAWQGSASPGESFMHWIVWDNIGAIVLGGSALLVVSALLGAVGGAIGSGLGRRRRQAASA
jgi:hypothetical protein